jgi:uncharacterized membrane protein
MVKRVLVRSRSGNLILAFVGGVYALSAIAVLAWFVIDVWQAAVIADVILQVALVASAACGVWFVSIALANLRQRTRDTSKPASIHR